MAYALNICINLSWMEIDVMPGEGIASNAEMVVKHWQQYIMAYSVKWCTVVHYN